MYNIPAGDDTPEHDKNKILQMKKTCSFYNSNKIFIRSLGIKTVEQTTTKPQRDTVSKNNY